MIRESLARVWREHRRAVLAAAILAWTVGIVFAYQKVKPKLPAGMATPPPGARVLEVGALPVT
ncbi:MAG: hypothetical protein HYR48_02310 [Gemmatimonadetes bacterium]|nr:hypothetical protein [Gemmatimonadota bacterium]